MTMKVIYEPAGRAREYAPLAFNPWIGCTGGCRYCYAKHMARKSAEDFHKVPVPKDKLAAFEKDCKALQMMNDDRIIFMSFMCDPFQSFGDQVRDGLIYEYVNIALMYGRKVRTLTKVPSNVWFPDIDAPIDFGVTIAGTDNDLNIEPKTNFEYERLYWLLTAKENNHTTWVSMEPVIDVDVCLSVLREYQANVDFWRIGKLNARTADMKAIERSIDWKEFGNEVRRIMPTGKYMLKADLLKEME